MARLSPEQFHDELIYRQVMFTRYVNGQVKHVQTMVDELNLVLGRRCVREDIVETKRQYNELRMYIRKTCITHRKKLIRYMQKEIAQLVKEQSAWLYEYLPIRPEKPHQKQMVRNIYFGAFSDRHTIKAWIVDLYNRLFQLWNSQLTIAYRVGTPMKTMVSGITGKGGW